ncbi:MAG: hypothetical protein HYR96_16125, partial [Deltaproteobacteria bacterium]|nr:hypothetical protein [Deltaproteobacteria bacterium]
MITAVDTSILVDILAADPSHLKASKFLLTKCLQEGRIIASAVAWAELRPLFESTGQMAKVMGIMMVDFDPLDEMAANLAGE